MKFILVSNILENSSFISFLEDALVKYPEAGFIVAGDLLNVFPETKENLADSMVYELYGRWVTDELEKLQNRRFSFCRHSPFTKALQAMFLPLGEYYQKAQTMALRRYEKIFSNIEAILGHNKMYFISGDMDYPILEECVTRSSACFRSLDSRVVKLLDTTFAGVGGTTEKLHPVCGIIDSTPNQMAVAEFKRKLNMLANVDILVTHIAPEESKELKEFIRNSQVKLVICKAPFYRKNNENIPGKLEITNLYDTAVIKVRPFASTDHQAMVIDVANGKFDANNVQIFNWSAPLAAEYK